MKIITRIIISTLLMMSASGVCMADPPDPPAPQQPSGYTVCLPG